MRPTHSAWAGVVTSIQPPAISRSSTPAPRVVYASPSSRSAASTASGADSSDSLSSAGVSGWSDENSSASSAGSRFNGGTVGFSWLAGDDRDVAERLVLDDERRPELDELQQG